MPQLATRTRNAQGRSRPRRKATTTRIVNVRLLVATIAVIGVGLPLTYVWYRYQVRRTAAVFLSRAVALEAEQQWEEAAAYRARYLQLRPGDVEQQLRMVDDLTRVVQTPRSQRRLSVRLYEALGLAPARHDLRVKLAKNLFEQKDFEAASEQAQHVLASSAKADEKRLARRILALATNSQALPGGRISMEQAARALGEALTDWPGDVQLASLTATLYREHPDTVETVDRDAATRADQIMDQLVAHDPCNPDALMARHKYRVRHGLPGADRDLRDALKYEPNHVDGLLAAAAAASTAGRDGRTTAEGYFRRVIATAPRDPRGYTGLARLLTASQDRDGAMRVLQQGRDAVGTESFVINSELQATYRDSNDLANAERVLNDLDISLRRLLPELSTPNRLGLENHLRLERARLEFARGEVASAMRNLKAIMAAAGQDEQLSESSVRFQALVLSAEMMEQLGRWDVAAGYWDTLTDEMERQAGYWEALPDEAPGKNVFRNRHYLAGRAYLQAGQPADAIEQLENDLVTSPRNADASILLLTSHFWQQTRRPAGERNWSEFLALLGTTQQQLPDRWEPIVMESDYLATLGSEEARHTAAVRLRTSEQRFPTDKNFWERLVRSYQQLGEPQDAERALGKYMELESDARQQALVHAEFLARDNKIDEADTVLAAMLPTLDEPDRTEVSRQRVQLLLSAGQLAEAERVLAASLLSNPQDERLLAAAIEIALTQEDFETAIRREEQLAKLKPPDDFPWRFLRARRLLGQFATLDAAARRELDVLINSMRTERPRWYPVVTLAAAHAELIGNPRQAITELELANALGDNSTETLGRLVRLLNSEGRYDQAQSYLVQLTAEQPANMQIESLAISTAVKRNRIQEAIQLAQQAVERHPEDAVPRMWLADVYAFDDRQQEAAQILRDCVAQFPEDVRVRSALVTLLARTQRTDEARRLLEALRVQVGVETTTRHFVAAQGFELLGDQDTARAEYQAALNADANRIDIRLRYARLLMSNDVAAAREQYAVILKLDPDNVAAKRQLATLWAATGRDEDWNRAMQLLQSLEDASTLPAADDYRLRAVLLTRRGRTRAERLGNLRVARGILSERLDRTAGAADDTDRLLLASIHEQEASLSGDVTTLEAAREQLRGLLDRKKASADYLLLYVEFLLRHAQSRLVEDAAASQDDAANIRDVYMSDASLRLDELDALVSGATAGSPTAIRSAGLRAALLKAEGRPEEAVKMLGEFARRNETQFQSDADRARFSLAMGNLQSAIEQHAEAEKWYRELMSLAPGSYVPLVQSLARQGKVSDAAALCLRIASERPSAEVAAILAQLIASAPGDDETYQQIQPMIASAMESNGDTVDLLMSVAVMYVTRNESERAIDLFQQILERAPDNTVALNNLATLLGERSNRQAEALEHIERAMQISGRIPALLDTRGTVLLNAGKYAEAVACLEEATAGGAADSRYYFHLALAYQHSGQDGKARDSLELSRQRGLDTAILTEGDRAQLAALEQNLLAQTKAE